VGPKQFDPEIWEQRYSSRGISHLVDRRKLKVRGAAHFLQSVIFIYPSKEAADNSREEGASGFLVGIPSKVFPEACYVYAVTNRHVIEKGGSVIRINTTNGAVKVIDLKPSDWVKSDTDDLAACELTLDSTKHEFRLILPELFLTPKDIKEYQMGAGMEVFIVGRFTAHSGNLRNHPAARFGAVSMLESEPIKQSGGHRQESFLVEMHTASGYSGSPVFIYVSKQTPGTRVTMGWDYKSWLLGVDWGHLPKWEDLIDKGERKHPDGWGINTNSGMTGVVPCWKLLEFLNSEDFAESRERQEIVAATERNTTGLLDVAPTDEGRPRSAKTEA
jgi:hypothetical protein